jgi:hypothetical protein
MQTNFDQTGLHEQSELDKLYSQLRIQCENEVSYETKIKELKGKNMYLERQMGTIEEEFNKKGKLNDKKSEEIDKIMMQSEDYLSTVIRFQKEELEQNQKLKEMSK